jgi:hypothetical protein
VRRSSSSRVSVSSRASPHSWRSRRSRSSAGWRAGRSPACPCSRRIGGRPKRHGRFDSKVCNPGVGVHSRSSPIRACRRASVDEGTVDCCRWILPHDGVGCRRDRLPRESGCWHRVFPRFPSVAHANRAGNDNRLPLFTACRGARDAFRSGREAFGRAEHFRVYRNAAAMMRRAICLARGRRRPRRDRLGCPMAVLARLPHTMPPRLW